MSTRKLVLDVSDPETRAIWETAKAARREVASWPAWKRGETLNTDTRRTCMPGAEFDWLDGEEPLYVSDYLDKYDEIPEQASLAAGGHNLLWFRFTGLVCGRARYEIIK